MQDDHLTGRIIGIAIDVHRQLGPGLLESVYRECLAFDLIQAGYKVEIEKRIPIQYKSLRFEKGYRADLVVNERIVIELKSVKAIEDVFISQIITYLKMSNCKTGLIINFNVSVLKNGIKRVVI